MRAVSVLAALALVAWGDFKQAGPADAAAPVDGASAGVAEAGGAAPGHEGDAGDPVRPLDAGLKVTPELLVKDRSRVGARTTLGVFVFWRGGIAVHGDRVFWVEAGTSPGLYSASATTPCATSACVTKLATFTRPSAFHAFAGGLLIADTTSLRRYAFPQAQAEAVASHTTELLNVVGDGTVVFWTAGSESNIRRTSGGTTTTPIFSNGTPIAMGLAGTWVYWAGVDISGQAGALQRVSITGAQASEVTRFSDGFHVLRGTPTVLYYAKDSPATVSRVAMSTGRTEIVARDALGVTDIATDDTHAYWVEPGDGDFRNGRLRRVAHDSMTAETVAESLVRPVGVAVAGKSVYVASAGTSAQGYADGAIVRLTLE